MSQWSEKLRKVVTNFLFSIRLCYEASKKYFILKTITLFCQSFFNLIDIWILKEIINEIEKRIRFKELNSTYIITLVLFYLLFLTGVELLTHLRQYLSLCYEDEMVFHLEKVMMEKTSKIDLEYYDMANIGDKIAYTRSNFDVMKEMTWTAFDVSIEIINIVAVLVIICSMFPFWGIMTIILLIPSFVLQRKYTKTILEIDQRHIRDRRMMDYLRNGFNDNSIQFEMKLNNISDYFIRKYKELWTKDYVDNVDENRKYQLKNIVFKCLNSLTEFAVLICAAAAVFKGQLLIGYLQYSLSMVKNLREQVEYLLYDINQYMLNDDRLNQVKEFIQIGENKEVSGQKILGESFKIEFKHVYFKYPATEEYVLKDCSFVINEGEHVGLIGLNGSGKSTIIRLLLRFYLPNKGEILINDTPIEEYEVYELRKRFGVLFQEAITYCLPVKEIVALSNFKELGNVDKIRKVCRLSGIDEVIQQWKKGYDSVIGRFYADDGEDFSGGQWQKIGLARAYFRDANFYILDEPSAALDAISEKKIFHQLYELSDDKAFILITHQLSNTISANKILVLENGQIIECGSHSELMEHNGKYAYMFRLQAQRYQ